MTKADIDTSEDKFYDAKMEAVTRIMRKEMQQQQEIDDNLEMQRRINVHRYFTFRTIRGFHRRYGVFSGTRQIFKIWYSEWRERGIKTMREERRRYYEQIGEMVKAEGIAARRFGDKLWRFEHELGKQDPEGFAAYRKEKAEAEKQKETQIVMLCALIGFVVLAFILTALFGKLD